MDEPPECNERGKEKDERGVSAKQFENKRANGGEREKKREGEKKN